ncbi:hypothetical protein M407DRAFT_245648 [Tulasnella calospora MUT 4182]|uniref:Uncharacterized protein n=1 Tax=Tulasnella calospora MUT 4182 TaxID=1051891 RepID=A0A0C3PZI2_9AGAM|nr:hypothetical protein M407DRAFT_245648 [Tulasnella calospora MUT 4182]
MKLVHRRPRVDDVNIWVVGRDGRGLRMKKMRKRQLIVITRASNAASCPRIYSDSDNVAKVSLSRRRPHRQGGRRRQ